MLVRLNRFFSTQDETIGVLTINRIHECFTLEDEYRADKIMHETRIPAGEYQLALKAHGGFYSRYTDRFAPWHRGMIEVREVPGFTDILIHCGNTDEHTSGCILVGDIADINNHERGMVIGRSAQAYARVYDKISDALLNRERVVLQVTDGDRPR